MATESLEQEQHPARPPTSFPRFLPESARKQTAYAWTDNTILQAKIIIRQAFISLLQKKKLERQQPPQLQEVQTCPGLHSDRRGPCTE